MKKIHKILIPVFSVLLVISIAALVVSFNGNIMAKLTGKANDDFSSVGFKGDDFSSLSPVSAVSDYPLVKSDIDSIYYCVKPDGKVSFYEYNGSALAPYTGDVETKDLKPECSYVNIPITVYYIEKDGKTLGYGLFTNANDDSVELYSYVFAKLIDAPTVYDLQSKMLLLSTDEKEAYSADKSYCEIFSVNMENGKCTNVASQRDRPADKTGRLSERWTILTDSYLRTISKKAAVISGRLYDSETKTYDVYDLNKGVNSPAFKGIYGRFLREDSDGGYIYITKTDDGFKSAKYITDEKDIAVFTGNIEEDFIFSGDWVYSKNNKTFTNLLTAKEIKASKIDTGFNTFCVNSDGSKIVALASGQNQAFIVIKEDGSVKQYVGDSIFSTDIKNAVFADDETVMTTALNSDGACVNYFTKIG